MTDQEKIAPQLRARLESLSSDLDAARERITELENDLGTARQDLRYLNADQKRMRAALEQIMATTSALTGRHTMELVSDIVRAALEEVADGA